MTDRRAGTRQGPYVAKELRARNKDRSWRKSEMMRENLIRQVSMSAPLRLETRNVSDSSVAVSSERCK